MAIVVNRSLPEDSLTSREMRWLRQRSGISQAWLAALLGIDKNTVARMERDEIGIRLPLGRLMMFALAELQERPVEEWREALKRYRRRTAR